MISLLGNWEEALYDHQSHLPTPNTTGFNQVSAAVRSSRPFDSNLTRPSFNLFQHYFERTTNRVDGVLIDIP
jgi:hypothetical protein